MFKVGDKVRVKYGQYLGREGVICCFHEEFCAVYGVPFLKKTDNLELVKPEHDFKVRDKVKDKYGQMWIIVDVKKDNIEIVAKPWDWNAELPLIAVSFNADDLKKVESEKKPEQKFKAGDRVRVKGRFGIGIVMSGRESGLPAYIVVDFCDGPKYIDTSCLELVKPEEEKKPEPEFKVKVCSGGLSGGGDGISGKMRFTFPDVDVNPFEEPKFKVGDTVYVEARITKINCDVKEFPYWVMLPGSHSKVCAIIDKVIKKKE